MPRGVPAVKGEQAPKKAGLFSVNPGMHGVIWERDKEALSDPVEELRDQGYEIVTDPEKRRGRAEIPLEVFRAKEKAQHERSATLQYGKAGKGEVRVVQKPTTLADFAKEDEDYTKAAKEAGIVAEDDDES